MMKSINYVIQLQVSLVRTSRCDCSSLCLCIFGLVNPLDYRDHVCPLRVGTEMKRDEYATSLKLICSLSGNDIDFPAWKI